MYLGYVNVDHMLRSMSSTQFSEWVAFFQISPPEDEWDHRFGLIAASIYNTTPRGKSGSRKVYEPTDFYRQRAVKPPPDPEEMLRKVISINEQAMGRDLRKKRDGKG